MSIVFGFDGDDLEPVDWLERLDLVDEALWVPEQLTEAVVFFDAAQLGRWDPGEEIEAVLQSTPQACALTLERWGYLASGQEETRASLAKLERDQSASPLLRYHYDCGSLLVAVVSAPVSTAMAVTQLRQHPICLEVVRCGGHGCSLALLDHDFV